MPIHCVIKCEIFFPSCPRIALRAKILIISYTASWRNHLGTKPLLRTYWQLTLLNWPFWHPHPQPHFQTKRLGGPKLCGGAVSIHSGKLVPVPRRRLEAGAEYIPFLSSPDHLLSNSLQVDWWGNLHPQNPFCHKMWHNHRGDTPAYLQAPLMLQEAGILGARLEFCLHREDEGWGIFDPWSQVWGDSWNNHL